MSKSKIINEYPRLLIISPAPVIPLMKNTAI